MENNPQDRQQYKLLPPGEREYVELTSEKQKEYNRNTVQQYNTRIRYRATNAIMELDWLVKKLPMEQLEKILTEDRVIDLCVILEKALAVSGWKPGSNDPFLRSHILQELKHLLPERDYDSIRKIIYRPEDLRDINEENESVYRRNQELSGEIDLLKSILETHGIAGDDLRKERYIHRNASKIKNLEESLKDAHPASDEYKEIEKRIETMRSESWDMYKKHILKEINQLEEEKKKTNNTILIHLIDTAIQRQRERLG